MILSGLGIVVLFGYALSSMACYLMDYPIVSSRGGSI